MRECATSMRFLAAILLLIPALLHSQSPGTPIELGPSAVPLAGPWKFSPGDSPWVNGEPVWAQPGYDDSHWDTMDLTPQAGSFDVLYGSTGYVPGWTTRGYPNLTGYAWYRLRIRIDSHGRPVALQMPLNVDDGYQVFANGRYLGQVAQFGPHGVVLHYAVAVVLPPLQLAPDGSVELAIRCFMSPGSPTRWPKVGGLHNPPIIGLLSTIDLLHQATETTIRQYVTGNLVTALIFFLAVPLPLWAWISHRHDRTWLLLFFAVVAIFASEAVSIGAMLTSHVSIGLGEFWRSVVDPAIELCWTLFWWQWFGLRDKPWIRSAAWLLMAANVFVGFCLSSPFFGLSFAGQSLLRACSSASLVIFSAQGALLLLLLLEAFRRDRIAASLAAVPILLLAFNNFYVPLLVRFHTRSKFHVVGMDIGTSEICFILMLLIVGALSLRRFLSIRDRELIDRESIATDLEQARELQQRVLVPENTRSDAYSVQVEYRPALTVGGDFFQTLTHPDGTLTVLIGDVSGKGVSAAMLVAVLVGAARARARQTDDPAAILEELNAQMIGRSGGHFATCIVASLGADGTLRLANAGHLPPYLNGAEIAVPGSLPLGMTAILEPATIICALKPDDRLTFMSDGVVEAQSPTGELFGFDRTAAISTQSAEAIAQAAQQFGQEDDITVLTVTFAPAEVLHA